MRTWNCTNSHSVCQTSQDERITRMAGRLFTCPQKSSQNHTIELQFEHVELSTGK